MKIEIIGGNKAYRDALLNKLADELDPKGILGRENPGNKKPKSKKQKGTK